MCLISYCVLGLNYLPPGKTGEFIGEPTRSGLYIVGRLATD